MTTWTLEHAKLIVAAWPEVEECDDGRWHKVGYGLDNPYICTKELGRPERFRLPPKKRIVEWTAQDVKPGMVFRLKDSPCNGWMPIESVVPAGVYLVGNMVGWAELAAHYVNSFDAVTWFPCHKEVEQ